MLMQRVAVAADDDKIERVPAARPFLALCRSASGGLVVRARQRAIDAHDAPDPSPDG